MSAITDVLELKDVTARVTWGVVRGVLDSQQPGEAVITLQGADAQWDVTITARKQKTARKKATRRNTAPVEAVAKKPTTRIRKAVKK